MKTVSGKQSRKIKFLAQSTSLLWFYNIESCIKRIDLDQLNNKMFKISNFTHSSFTNSLGNKVKVLIENYAYFVVVKIEKEISV